MTTPAFPLKTPRLRSPKTVPTGLKVSVGRSLPIAIQKLVQELNPEKIVLFGSYAYGNPNPDSDVDLLVIMKTKASPRTEAGRYPVCCYHVISQLIFS